jgi:predicted DNA-binding transcriptional regulator YafY
MAALPGPMRAQASAIRERLHVDATGWRETGEDLSMLTLVQDAVARERRLVFDYTRADGHKAKRTVDPLGLVAKGLSWYLVALAANGLRTYRVSRMESVTALAVGFERPAHFDLAAYWARSTAELKQQLRSYPAVLSLTIEGARRLQAWCATKPVARSDNEGEDRVILQADLETEEHARFVVLGLGSQVRIVVPKELRQWVREEAKKMAHESAKENTKE